MSAPLNILLLGYGKMGRAIEAVALSRGHRLAARIDLGNRAELDALPTHAVDVVIEFSSPEAVVANLHYCVERGWPVVCGTTGWLAQRPDIEAAVLARGSGFFYASNYSIGVNLFFRLNKVLAKLMGHQPDYAVALTEIHHTQKLDAPSGTAITLAEGILENLPHATHWALSDENAALTAPDVLPIESVREGNVPGTHTVRYTSAQDTIEITHTAHSREGFALGATLAAEWVAHRQGVFGMDDLLA